jgi:hypothetical protein
VFTILLFPFSFLADMHDAKKAGKLDEFDKAVEAASNSNSGGGGGRGRRAAGNYKFSDGVGGDDGRWLSRKNVIIGVVALVAICYRLWQMRTAMRMRSDAIRNGDAWPPSNAE